MYKNLLQVLPATTLLTQEGCASPHQKQIHRLTQHTTTCSPCRKQRGPRTTQLSLSHRSSSALATAERWAPTSPGTLLGSATALC